MDSRNWQFWVDRGGTFTDVIGRSLDGAIETVKLLSENPEHYRDAAIAAVRMITGISDGPLPPVEMRIGTTVATNALLEHKGEPTCLAITRGFGDALRIGYQERPKLFVRHIEPPEPLHGKVIEIDERINAKGDVLTPLDEDAARTGLEAAYDAGYRALAIVLMHGYLYTQHEQRLAEIAGEIGFPQISVSHIIAPLIKLVGRGDTTLVDAYLSPVLRQYVEQLKADAGGNISALFMQSNGGLTSSDSFRGKDAILSGPAGGIVGMAKTAAQAGIKDIIGFDMGGTSTDVSHYAGHYERESETMVAGVRIRAPMMRIHTVAAGGGSICTFDGARFQVGPHSAGAVPGPACYRRGGPLTVTDCNVMLGKIAPAHFPNIFGPNGNQPLDADVVRDTFEALVVDVAAATAKQMRAEEIAEGFVAIAVANMANAIKKISIERGHDVTRYTLACFGGAGGQHACLVADALGMDRVMIHPLAGVLSAYGMGLADRRAIRERTFGDALEQATLGPIVQSLSVEAEAELRAQGVDGDISSEATVHIRYVGTDSSIEIPFGDVTAMQAAFEARHSSQFGFVSDKALVVEMVRVEAIHASAFDADIHFARSAGSNLPIKDVSCFMAGAQYDAPLYDRSALAAGFSAIGPAIIIDPVSTTIVEPGWKVAVDAIGNLMLSRSTARRTGGVVGTEVDPVRLEIMGGLFMAIAEEMGAALARTASSVNIRERLDFSCALFDAAGRLVANAPHMPVHLGSMGESVARIIAARGDARDGRTLAREALLAPTG